MYDDGFTLHQKERLVSSESYDVQHLILSEKMTEILEINKLVAFLIKHNSTILDWLIDLSYFLFRNFYEK